MAFLDLVFCKRTRCNIRGWLKGINDNGTANNDLTINGNDLFGFKLNYNDPKNFGSSENPDPLYNGNISQTLWQTQSPNPTANPVSERYSYSYDPLNRIISAIDDTADNRYSLTNIEYDKNGNIQNLTRNGYQESSTFTDMDVLDYDYDNGNLLLKVADTGNKAYGFKDGTNTGDDFEYDANANMTVDRNKGITNISYNYLDLPDAITVNGNGNNGTVEFVYAADGLKLQKKKTENGVTVTTDYSGRYIYENGNLKQFSHSEGYVEVDGQGGYDYVYSYLDHLGTVRLTYSDFNGNGSIEPSTEILKERNTYPFGLEHEGYNIVQNGTESNYQTYLGQEMNNELGLDWLTFRYRNYMPEIGRFFGSDPISEEYFTISPYQFAHNNPVWKVEIEGLEGETSNIVKDVITHEPIKLRKLPTLSKSTVGGGKLVLKGTGTFVVKETAKKSVLRRVGGAIARGASNTVMALLNTQGLNRNGLFKPPTNTDIEFTPEQQKTIDDLGKPKIDEKLRIKDLKIETVDGDNDSPIKRIGDFDLLHSEDVITGSQSYDDIANLSDDELIESVTNPENGDFVTINSKTGKVIDGNTRVYEIQRRGLEVDIPYRVHNPNDSDYFYDID